MHISYTEINSNHDYFPFIFLSLFIFYEAKRINIHCPKVRYMLSQVKADIVHLDLTLVTLLNHLRPRPILERIEGISLAQQSHNIVLTRIFRSL